MTTCYLSLCAFEDVSQQLDNVNKIFDCINNVETPVAIRSFSEIGLLLIGYLSVICGNSKAGNHFMQNLFLAF